MFIFLPLLRLEQYVLEQNVSLYFDHCFHQRFSLTLSSNLKSKISAQVFMNYAQGRNHVNFLGGAMQI